MMGEVCRLLFLLAGRISTSLIGSFGSSGCSFSPHLFMLGSFHPPTPHFVCLFFLKGMGLFAFLQKHLTTRNKRGTFGFGSCYNQPVVCKRSCLQIKIMSSLRRTEVK